ncbi:N-6 DNA methylase [Prescottella agglutinans]|uniref:DNA methylase adenine-specific domain-containing protein n=1 Tax=Prescottella agglutinans TaxID=1644129 RepID=A0ABT6MKH7_9NOCA|nr:N-6 DNA methylase [Prescottella agglutinans]MDH6284301.1 hypothetical protein [Prescottella agglutinans]
MPDPRPTTTARDIAAAVTDAWRRTSNNPSTLEIPLGTVAALSLHCLVADQPAQSTRALAQLDRSDLLAVLEETWARAWFTQPYLVEIASPLRRWLDADVSDDTIRSVRAVLDAAVSAGLPRLIDPRPGTPVVDVLGYLSTELRPARARQHLGEFYTPPEVADVMATLTIPELPAPGRLFTDPTAGTGGLLAATANRIRALGGDPGDYGWEMGDINHLSVACAAANAITWGLGNHVLVYRADTLAPGDHRAEAIATRTAVIDHHQSVVRAARLAALLTRQPTAAAQTPVAAAS